jgi:DNA-directed RNA polymerase subunit RPC12/RpoP
MQTVNFNCSHCGKLMAVGLNLLGRNVRCPHCKQVVLAPASAVPSAPPPPQVSSELSFNLPAKPKESHESIFGEVHDDDVFGTRQPKVHVPVEAEPPPMRRLEQEPTAEMPQEPAEKLQFPVYQPMSRTEPIPEFNPPGPQPWDPPAPPQPSRPIVADVNPWDEPAPTARRPAVPEPARSREPAPIEPYSARERELARGGGGGVFIFILLLYSAAATAAVAYLYFNRTTGGGEQSNKENPPAVHPFSAIPDLFGHYEKANRKEIVRPKGMADALQDVPANLRVGIGDALPIHNIEVVPVKIESREVTRYDRVPGNNKPSTKSYRMLLLHLRIKNTSDDVTLHPTDPAFNARYSKVLPYTGIFAGDKHFLGGPWFWPDRQYDRQYIEGQEDDDKPLGPKEERVYVVASTVDHRQIVEQLYAVTSGLWHVQLRTGFLPYKDGSGIERDAPVTSVIGVPFTYSDVQFPK